VPESATEAHRISDADTNEIRITQVSCILWWIKLVPQIVPGELLLNVVKLKAHS
jgi:hypothetical protein